MNKLIVFGTAFILSACNHSNNESIKVSKIVKEYFDRKTLLNGDKIDFNGKITDFFEDKAALKINDKSGIVIKMPSAGKFEIGKEYDFKRCTVSGSNTYEGNRFVHVENCEISE